MEKIRMVRQTSVPEQPDLNSLPSRQTREAGSCPPCVILAAPSAITLSWQHSDMEITKRVTTIIFDFGGVLLDWDPRYLYRKLFMNDEPAMERFLAEVDFFDWNLQQDAGRPFDLAVEELCAQYPHHCELILAYDRRWEESISGPIQPTVALLDPLRDTGYRLAGLSNWSAEKFQLVRHKYEFLEWFETIVISGDVGLVKPDRRIFLLLLERLQDPAGQCLLIDDSPSNIDAARQLGFQTIHYQSPTQLKEALINLGVLLNQ